MTTHTAISGHDAAPPPLLAQGSACGKVILCGEHAVVYGRPAMAAPLRSLRAVADVYAGPAGHGTVIEAADTGQRFRLTAAPAAEPLAAAARLALAHIGMDNPDWHIVVRSALPIAGGLGSGAAVSAAVMRAIGSAAQREIPPADLSPLVFEVEKLHHGTPGGIDNTVIAYEQPIWFVRGQPPQPLAVAAPCTLLLADTGVASLTKQAVGDVRRAWQREPHQYEALFDRVAAIVAAARQALAAGDWPALGHLFNQNQTLLQALGVSAPELERLQAAALVAGALGAKLSGAGRGGNLIALVTPETAEPVAAALRQAGARRVLVSQIG